MLPSFLHAQVHPNHHSPPHIKPKHFEFAGKLVGKCLYETAMQNVTLVKGCFTRSFLAQILGFKINHKVVVHSSSVLHHSWSVVNNDVRQIALNTECCFTVFRDWWPRPIQDEGNVYTRPQHGGAGPGAGVCGWGVHPRFQCSTGWLEDSEMHARHGLVKTSKPHMHLGLVTFCCGRWNESYFSYEDQFYNEGDQIAN